MPILIGITILLACQLAGEILDIWLSLPIPGPVVGMMLLLTILIIRGKPGRPLEDTSNALLSHLSLLFIPAGVGVIIHIDRLSEEWLPITIALVVSTLVTLVATALIMMTLLRLTGRASKGGLND